MKPSLHVSTRTSNSNPAPLSSDTSTTTTTTTTKTKIMTSGLAPRAIGTSISTSVSASKPAPEPPTSSASVLAPVAVSAPMIPKKKCSLDRSVSLEILQPATLTHQFPDSNRKSPSYQTSLFSSIDASSSARSPVRTPRRGPISPRRRNTIGGSTLKKGNSAATKITTATTINNTNDSAAKIFDQSSYFDEESTDESDINNNHTTADMGSHDLTQQQQHPYPLQHKHLQKIRRNTQSYSTASDPSSRSRSQRSVRFAPSINECELNIQYTTTNSYSLKFIEAQKEKPNFSKKKSRGNLSSRDDLERKLSPPPLKTWSDFGIDDEITAALPVQTGSPSSTPRATATALVAAPAQQNNQHRSTPPLTAMLRESKLVQAFSPGSKFKAIFNITHRQSDPRNPKPSFKKPASPTSTPVYSPLAKSDSTGPSAGWS